MGNQVIRSRKRVQPGTETTQTNVIVHGNWQLSLIALRELKLDEGRNQGTGQGKDRETLRAGKGAKKRDLTSDFAYLKASQ